MINSGTLRGNQVGSMAPAKSLRKKVATKSSPARDAFQAFNALLLRENALNQGRQKSIPVSHRNGPNIR